MVTKPIDNLSIIHNEPFRVCTHALPLRRNGKGLLIYFWYRYRDFAKYSQRSHFLKITHALRSLTFVSKKCREGTNRLGRSTQMLSVSLGSSRDRSKQTSNRGELYICKMRRMRWVRSVVVGLLGAEQPPSSSSTLYTVEKTGKHRIRIFFKKSLEDKIIIIIIEPELNFSTALM